MNGPVLEREGKDPPSQWWSRERTFALALLLITAVALAISVLISLPFIPPLAWALALAIVAAPLHNRVRFYVRNRNVAASISVVLVAITIVGPAILVFERVVNEAAKGVELIQSEVISGRWRAALEQHPRVSSIINWLEKQFDVKQAQNAAMAVTNKATSVVKGGIWWAIELLITFFALFYFFRDRVRILQVLRSLLPLSSNETDELFCRVADTLSATISGTIVVALVQGTLGALMFWWLGLPAPFLWGVVMALLALVPVLGAFVVWVPAAILLGLEGNWMKALILTSWGIVVIGLIDNILYPVLMGKKLRLHTLAVFIAIVGGIMMFGASGLILGPLALALTWELLELWRQRLRAGEIAEETVED